MKTSKSLIVYFILVHFIILDQLYAYIDFGTLSAFFQLILAGMVGFIVYARNYISLFFQRIINIFKKKSNSK